MRQEAALPETDPPGFERPDPGPRDGGPIATRWSGPQDCAALADLHRAAWRYAYAGVLPGLALERMISRRGPAWWTAMHRAGGRALLLCGPDAIGGYATLGPDRRDRTGGEIYELYLRPEWQGAGLGRRLFETARARLADTGRLRLTVWSLADNALGCRFYRAMGGTEFARSRDHASGAGLPTIGFAWG